MSYKANAPLVVAKSETGADVYVYQDEPIPDGQSDEWVRQMLDEGLIVEDPADESGDKPRAAARRGD